MSLTLIQGYSSADEEEEAEERTVEDYENSDEEDGDDLSAVRSYKSSSGFDVSTGDSSLPSADDVFSQVSGPPAFLNNCTDADEEASARDAAHAKRLSRKKKRDVPKGAVLEAKPQLVGIHERVRSDIDAKPPPSQSSEKRAPTATNPNLEEAAELLRMCTQCGIPKTYSSAKGMVCPVCGDRPLPEPDSKKKGSTIKDKEKSKRMRGQSSHATWKSETEMHLRQQFD